VNRSEQSVEEVHYTQQVNNTKHQIVSACGTVTPACSEN